MVGYPVIGRGTVDREEKSFWGWIRKSKDSVDVEDGVGDMSSLHKSCLIRVNQRGGVSLGSRGKNGRKDFEVSVRKCNWSAVVYMVGVSVFLMKQNSLGL